MNPKQRLLVLVYCCIGLAIATIIVIGVSMSQSQSSTLPSTISKTGTITCLPHKGDGPQTLECAFGLKADDNSYYGLTSLPRTYETVGQHVTVTGPLVAPGPTNIYNIAGNISVESIKKL